MAEATTMLRCPYCNELLEFTVTLVADRYEAPGLTRITVRADDDRIGMVMEAHLSSRFERFGSVEDHEGLLVTL